MHRNSIGIIGMGYVGSSVAISILQKGLCKELLLSDIRKDLAEGEAMDLNHGSSFYPTSEVQASSIEEMKDCRIVVVTAGRGGTPNESRLDLLKDNIQIARSISEKLAGFKGILIVVANPVDVLTYFYHKFTGLPEERVIGTGTLLDTARLRDIISRKLNIDPKSIHAQVVGEHGDSEVVLWSRAAIGSIALRNWPGWKQEYEKEIALEVKNAAIEIIKRKGATNHAIGLVTANLIKWILRGERRIINISRVVKGSHGLSELALSLSCIVSEKGAEEVLELQLEEEERVSLLNSAGILKQAIDSVS